MLKTARSTDTWTYVLKSGFFWRQLEYYDLIAYKDESQDADTPRFVWRLEIGGGGPTDGREICTGVAWTLAQAKKLALRSLTKSSY